MLAVAAVVIVAMLIAVIVSDILLLASLTPKPSLNGDSLDVTYYDNISTMKWDVRLFGYVRNYGLVGCFATLVYTISGAQEWKTNGSIELGFIPGNGGEIWTDREFHPGFGNIFDDSPSPDSLVLSYDFTYRIP